MANKTLQAAKTAKKDEFYTQLPDIENELKHYKDQFRGKIVYCNCDDPFESNFFKYFASNFNHLGLKKLITTSYSGSPITGTQLSLLEMKGLNPKGKQPFKIEINEVPDSTGEGAVDISDVEYLLKHDKNTSTPLKGSGDFRSPECIELLEQSDIVCTNPPFSLFREYVAQLIEHKKKFLIIGSLNAISYKEVFKFIKGNVLWLGYNNGAKTYEVPDNYQQNNAFIGKNGKKYAKMGNTGWYTNLDISKRHELLMLYKNYSLEEYPKYANYDAIEVSKVSEIPVDYKGEMGVPITFLNEYNPDQFDLIGSSSNLSKPIQTPDGLVYRYKDRNGYMRQAAKERFALQDGDTWRRIYDRIVIRNKKLRK